MQCDTSGTTFSAWDKPSGFPYGLCWSPVVDINEKLREAIDHSGPETLIATQDGEGGAALFHNGVHIGFAHDFPTCISLAQRLGCRVIVATLAAINCRRDGVDTWEFATPLDKAARREKLAVVVVFSCSEPCPRKALESVACKTRAADRKRKRRGSH